MSKLLLAALVAAVLFAPSVQAQSYSVDVAITDLAPVVVSNGTQIAIPFKVTATVSGTAPCIVGPQGTASYTVNLDAKLNNPPDSATYNGSNSTFVNVNPKQVIIAGPNLANSGPSRTVDGTLIVNAGPYSGAFLNATVDVTATFVSSNGGCTGTTAAPADSDTKTTRADFEPVEGYGEVVDNSKKMPGVGLGLSLVALAAFVALVRRN